ncbi:MAG: PEP-CTERM sorting domain-containing protein [Azonexaceae bacterium]|nr:PEP-CTERM sorting domain-containing protein [Azonexaceae bacterium]
MKKTLLVLALAAAVPVAANAASVDYDITVKSDSFLATSSSATFQLSWEDLLQSKNKKHIEVDGIYTLTLKNLTTGTKVLFDDINVGDDGFATAGTYTHTFDSLLSGDKYRVIFSGSWSGKSGANWTTDSLPSVSLAMAPATPVTSVPEPESYAMFLAGLGLIGAMARRKSI